MVSVIPKEFNENYVDHRVAYIGNIKPAVFNLKYNDKNRNIIQKFCKKLIKPCNFISMDIYIKEYVK